LTQKANSDLLNAQKSFEKKLAIQEQMSEKDASDNTAIRAVAFLYENPAQVFQMLSECDKAKSYYQKSFEMFSISEQKNALSDCDRKRIEKSQKSSPDSKEIKANLCNTSICIT
jgi:hypothetical protein